MSSAQLTIRWILWYETSWGQMLKRLIPLATLHSHIPLPLYSWPSARISTLPYDYNYTYHCLGVCDLRQGFPHCHMITITHTIASVFVIFGKDFHTAIWLHSHIPLPLYWWSSVRISTLPYDYIHTYHCLCVCDLWQGFPHCHMITFTHTIASVFVITFTHTIASVFVITFTHTIASVFVITFTHTIASVFVIFGKDFHTAIWLHSHIPLPRCLWSSARISTLPYDYIHTYHCLCVCDLRQGFPHCHRITFTHTIASVFVIFGKDFHTAIWLHSHIPLPLYLWSSARISTLPYDYNYTYHCLCVCDLRQGFPHCHMITITHTIASVFVIFGKDFHTAIWLQLHIPLPLCLWSLARISTLPYDYIHTYHCLCICDLRQGFPHCHMIIFTHTIASVFVIFGKDFHTAIWLYSHIPLPLCLWSSARISTLPYDYNYTYHCLGVCDLWQGFPHCHMITITHTIASVFVIFGKDFHTAIWLYSHIPLPLYWWSSARISTLPYDYNYTYHCLGVCDLRQGFPHCHMITITHTIASVFVIFGKDFHTAIWLYSHIPLPLYWWSSARISTLPYDYIHTYHCLCIGDLRQGFPHCHMITITHTIASVLVIFGKDFHTAIWLYSHIPLPLCLWSSARISTLPYDYNYTYHCLGVCDLRQGFPHCHMITITHTIASVLVIFGKDFHTAIWLQSHIPLPLYWWSSARISTLPYDYIHTYHCLCIGDLRQGFPHCHMITFTHTIASVLVIFGKDFHTAIWLHSHIPLPLCLWLHSHIPLPQCLWSLARISTLPYDYIHTYHCLCVGDLRQGFPHCHMITFTHTIASVFVIFGKDFHTAIWLQLHIPLPRCLWSLARISTRPYDYNYTYHCLGVCDLRQGFPHCHMIIFTHTIASVFVIFGKDFHTAIWLHSHIPLPLYLWSSARISTLPYDYIHTYHCLCVCDLWQGFPHCHMITFTHTIASVFVIFGKDFHTAIWLQSHIPLPLYSWSSARISTLPYDYIHTYHCLGVRDLRQGFPHCHLLKPHEYLQNRKKISTDTKLQQEDFVKYRCPSQQQSQNLVKSLNPTFCIHLTSKACDVS